MCTMGIGACIGMFLRQYVFVKPSIGESVATSLLCAAVTTLGHVFNYVVFTKTQVHAQAAVTHGVILFSDQVFELSVRLICLAELLAADTRYFLIAEYGFGEVPDTGLVLFNFVLSVVCQLVVAAGGIKLMHSSTKFNMEQWAASFKAWHAAVATGCFFAVAMSFSLRFRIACLMCLPPDHRDYYTCFD